METPQPSGLDWWEGVSRSDWSARVAEAQDTIAARTSPKVAHLLLEMELWRLEFGRPLEDGTE